MSQYVRSETMISITTKISLFRYGDKCFGTYILIFKRNFLPLSSMNNFKMKVADSPEMPVDIV
jgi:hypothetical protein